jgi:hypothetical protein
MLYRIFVLCVISFVLTACGGGGETTTQPSATQAPSAEQPANFAPPSTELAQTIVSETCVTYQLPTGWVVDDNDSVSNFGSDEDAVLDFIDGEKRNTRWLLIGSFGIFDETEVDTMAGITSLEQALPIMDNYSQLAYNPVVGPETITLPNGNLAYFVINQDGDILNVRYHMFGAEGVVINLYFSGSEASINASRDLMVAIANSASYTKP